MRKTLISGVMLGCLALLGAQRGQQVILTKVSAAGPVCTDGPTTNLIFRLDAPPAGTITTWTDSVGGVIGTFSGGAITSDASIFGSSPGVHFVAASSDYATLSSVVNGGANLNDFTVMIGWKSGTIVPGTGMYFTSATGGSPSGVFSYWVANVGSTQGADSAAIAQIGTGAASLASNTKYQMNLTYVQATSTQAFRLNSASDAGTASGYPVLTQGIQTIGAAHGGSFDFVDGWIGPFYIFAPHINLTDVQAWEATISCKYPGL